MVKLIFPAACLGNIVMGVYQGGEAQLSPLIEPGDLFPWRSQTVKQLNITHGFSLIEVLIAVFILTFGLLGITGLYINSLKRTEDAYWHVLATSQWAAMHEQQKARDYNCVDWSMECGRLLPHGECGCDAGKISICWCGKHEEQCIRDR